MRQKPKYGRITTVEELMREDAERLGVFKGMETAVAEQEHAALLHQAAELAEEMKKPLGDINAKAGNMEENSPLFYGKINPTLF